MKKTVIAAIGAGALLLSACSSGNTPEPMPTTPADPTAAMKAAARAQGLNREELAVADLYPYDTCQILKTNPTEQGYTEAVNEIRYKLHPLVNAGLVDDLGNGWWIVDHQIEFYCPEHLGLTDK